MDEPRGNKIISEYDCNISVGNKIISEYDRNTTLFGNRQHYARNNEQRDNLQQDERVRE